MITSHQPSLQIWLLGYRIEHLWWRLRSQQSELWKVTGLDLVDPIRQISYEKEGKSLCPGACDVGLGRSWQTRIQISLTENLAGRSLVCQYDCFALSR